MRIGEKLRQAITSSFIEVRMDDAPPATRPSLADSVPVISITPAVVAPTVEPAPKAPEPDPLTPPDFTDRLRNDGSLNDDVIFKEASLTPIAFTAEQAIDVLVEMHYGVTARGRCQAMAQAISVTTDDPSSAGHLVVSDAAQKMVALNQHMNRSREELQGFRRSVAEEMEQLHERLNRLRILVDETNANFHALEEASRVRVDNLTGVIAFFDEFQAYLRQESESRSAEDSELPAFMHDETVKKLLGVDTEKEAT